MQSTLHNKRPICEFETFKQKIKSNCFDMLDGMNELETNVQLNSNKKILNMQNISELTDDSKVYESDTLNLIFMITILLYGSRILGYLFFKFLMLFNKIYKIATLEK